MKSRGAPADELSRKERQTQEIKAKLEYLIKAREKLNSSPVEQVMQKVMSLTQPQKDLMKRIVEHIRKLPNAAQQHEAIRRFTPEQQALFKLYQQQRQIVEHQRQQRERISHANGIQANSNNKMMAPDTYQQQQHLNQQLLLGNHQLLQGK